MISNLHEILSDGTSLSKRWYLDLERIKKHGNNGHKVIKTHWINDAEEIR